MLASLGRDHAHSTRTELIFQRIQKVRRKIEQKQILMAQAEVRETRTRRRVTRPDYAYLNDPDSEVIDESH